MSDGGVVRASPSAGHGRADVVSTDGPLVASFVPDSMIRPMPTGDTR